MSHRLYNMLFRWVVHVCVCARVSRSISSSSSTSFLLPNSLRSPNLTTLTAFKLVSPILLPIIIILLPLYLSLSSILLYSSTIIFTSLSSSSFGTLLFPPLFFFFFVSCRVASVRFFFFSFFVPNKKRKTHGTIWHHLVVGIARSRVLHTLQVPETSGSPPPHSAAIAPAPE